MSRPRIRKLYFAQGVQFSTFTALSRKASFVFFFMRDYVVSDPNGDELLVGIPSKEGRFSSCYTTKSLCLSSSLRFRIFTNVNAPDSIKFILSLSTSMVLYMNIVSRVDV
jgi:hypothetical protein